MDFVKSYSALLLIFWSMGVKAQNIPLDTAAKDTFDDKIYNEAKFSLLTGNNIVQVGQVMSNSEFYLRPAAMYYHKSGIYLGGNLTLMPMDSQKYIDNYSLNLGYDRDFTEVVSAGIDYSFSHYYTSKQVTSSTNHILRPYISLDNKIVTPTLTPSVLIGSSVDYAMQLDLTHLFYIKNVFKKGDKFTIPISIGTNYGTSEFYNIYVQDRRNRGSSKLPRIDTTTVSQFGLTSIYGMASIKYKIKKTSINFSTSYYLTRDSYTKTLISNPLIFRLTLAYYIQK